MAIATVWSVCQKDLPNAVLAFCTLPILILGLVHPKISDKL